MEYLALTLFLASVGAPSSEVGSQVLARLERAYGGPHLHRLTRLRIESDGRLAWPGQGQSSEFVEFATDRVVKYFEFRKLRGTVERWTRQNGNVYHHRYVVDGDGAATVDYNEMTFERDPEGSFLGAFSPDYRGSDLLLARALAVEKAKFSHEGRRFYDGRTHDLLAFRVAPDTPLLTIYVGQDGLIRRLSMTRPVGRVDIVFAEHQRSKGVVFAGETRSFLDGTLVEYTSRLSTAPNPDRSEALELSDRLRPARRLVDTSRMTVDQLGAGVYLVGQEDYSLFVEHEQAYIAVNTSAGLKARFEALESHTHRAWPLAKAIATHHHRDHMDGLEEAIALGATVYLTPTARQVLSRKRAERQSSARVMELRDGQELGPLTVYVRPTSHAVENAFVYHRAERLLFQDDHYHGRFVSGPSWAQPTAVMLHQLLASLGIEVRALLSGHARKAEPRRLFDEAVQRTRPENLCPTGRSICRGPQEGSPRGRSRREPAVKR